MNENKKTRKANPVVKFILLGILILLPFLLYASLQAGSTTFSAILYSLLLAAFLVIILIN